MKEVSSLNCDLFRGEKSRRLQAGRDGSNNESAKTDAGKSLLCESLPQTAMRGSHIFGGHTLALTSADPPGKVACQNNEQ